MKKASELKVGDTFKKGNEIITITGIQNETKKMITFTYIVNGYTNYAYCGKETTYQVF